MGFDLYTYEDNSRLRSVVHWITDIIVAAAFAWFLVYGFLNQTIINGHSMSPTLEAGDICLVNRLAYDLGTPERFDVVVFEREDTGQQNVKRVVGLPGDKLQIVSGSVYINDQRLEDPRIGVLSLPGLAETPVTLGEEEYFLLGDNGDSSEDSRFINIGNVRLENIIGKVWFRLQPFQNIGLID